MYPRHSEHWKRRVRHRVVALTLLFCPRPALPTTRTPLLRLRARTSGATHATADRRIAAVAARPWPIAGRARGGATTRASTREPPQPSLNWTATTATRFPRRLRRPRHRPRRSRARRLPLSDSCVAVPPPTVFSSAPRPPSAPSATRARAHADCARHAGPSLSRRNRQSPESYRLPRTVSSRRAERGDGRERSGSLRFVRASFGTFVMARQQALRIAPPATDGRARAAAIKAAARRRHQAGGQDVSRPCRRPRLCFNANGRRRSLKDDCAGLSPFAD